MAEPYRQDSGTWAFVVEGPRRADGRRRQLRRKGFRTKRDAQAAMDELRRQLGHTYTGDTVTVAELADEWLTHLRVEGRLEADTIAEYETKLRLYIVPTLGPRKVRDVAPRDLTGMYADLAARMSARSVEYVHTTCSAMFRYAVNVAGYCPANPTRSVNPPKTRRTGTTIRAWTAEQLVVFLDAVADDPWFPAWHTIAHTGLRVSELAALHVDDVDVAGGRLSVTKSQKRDMSLGPTKRVRSSRTIALTTHNRQVLADHLRVQADVADGWGRPFEGVGHPLFGWEDGTRVRKDYLSRRFGQVIPAGLPNIGLHGLRHTHGTLMLLGGAPIHVVADRLGHDPATLLRTYSHVIGAMDEEAAAVFDRTLTHALGD